MKPPALLDRVIDEQPFPHLFVTLSGSHLYGFDSPDSDFDVRACHVLPSLEVVGLKMGPETIDASSVRDGVEIDFVSHDAAKFFKLMLGRNGYVLEQLYSPLVLRGGETHDRLKAIGHTCVTRHHAHHYLGFARNQWQLFRKEDPPRLKPLLYTYRVLLTGIHLMRSGTVEADLGRLNETFRIPYLDDLIARKRESTEAATVEDAGSGVHAVEYDRLTAELEQAYAASTLPDAPSAHDALHDLLVELRLGGA
jgi:predicted nucleotidyltransferase